MAIQIIAERNGKLRYDTYVNGICTVRMSEKPLKDTARRLMQSGHSLDSEVTIQHGEKAPVTIRTTISVALDMEY
jgi:hypothetical protein